MHFSPSNLAISVMALSNIVAAALTPDQIVSTIQMLTQKSEAVKAAAESINISSGPLGSMPIILGLTDLANAATIATAQIKGTPVVTRTADVDRIMKAFGNMISANRNIIIIILTSGPAGGKPFASLQIGSLLRPIENVVDTIATSAIKVPDGTDIRDQVDILKDTIARAMDVYGGP